MVSSGLEGVLRVVDGFEGELWALDGRLKVWIGEEGACAFAEKCVLNQRTCGVE